MTKHPEDNSKAPIPATELNDSELDKAAGGSTAGFEYGGFEYGGRQGQTVQQKPESQPTVLPTIP